MVSTSLRCKNEEWWASFHGIGNKLQVTPYLHADGDAIARERGGGRCGGGGLVVVVVVLVLLVLVLVLLEEGGMGVGGLAAQRRREGPLRLWVATNACI